MRLEKHLLHPIHSWLLQQNALSMRIKKSNPTAPKTRLDIHRYSSRYSGIEIKFDLRLAKRHQ